MSIESTLSSLRTLRYSAAKLADLITVGIADAEVRAQVREACLRELRWVDDLVGGESADGLRITDAEREVLATVRDIYASHDDDDSCGRIAAVIDALLERHAKGGEK